MSVQHPRQKSRAAAAHPHNENWRFSRRTLVRKTSRVRHWLRYDGPPHCYSPPPVDNWNTRSHANVKIGRISVNTSVRLGKKFTAYCLSLRHVSAKQLCEPNVPAEARF